MYEALKVLFTLILGIVPSYINFCEVPINIYSVLTMFRLNLLALSQSQTFRKSGNSSELISRALDILEDKPVSSAHIDMLESFTKLGKSFL